jgi:hypothetical protein
MPVLAIDHPDLVAVREQLPGGGDADHAGAHDQDAHAFSRAPR